MSKLIELVSNEYETILQLYSCRRRNLLFSIALQRILEKLSVVDEHCVSECCSTAHMDCWICCEKQTLFEDSLTKYYQERQKNDHLTANSTKNNGVSNVDNFSHLKELWASVENYYDAEQSDETFVQLKQPDIFVNNEKSSLQTVHEWEEKHKYLLKNWDDLPDDFTPDELIKVNTEPGFSTFLFKSKLNKEELGLRLPPSHLCSIKEVNNNSIVPITVCHKCLNQVSYDGYRDVATENHVISKLTNHIGACLRTESNPKLKNKSETVIQPPMLSSCKKTIKITVLRCKKNKKQIFPPHVIKNNPVVNLQSPFHIEPNVKLFGNSSDSAILLERSNGSVISQESVGQGLTSNPVLTRPSPTSLQQSVRSLLPTKVVKIVNKKSTFKQLNSGVKSRLFNKPKIVSAHGKVFIIPHSKSKNKMLKLVYSKPLSTICPNTNKYSAFPRFPVMKKMSITKLPTPTANDKKPAPPQNNDGLSMASKPVTKSRPSKRRETMTDGGPSKKVRKESFKKSTANQASKVSPKKKNSSKSKDLKLKDEESNSRQNRFKTPSKRKSAEERVSMKQIIEKYYSDAAATSDTFPQNSKRLDPKQRSVKKLIPIPYEAHYLCINETVARKGWKAYWYQKCRCAKPKKKKLAEAALILRKHQNDKKSAKSLTSADEGAGTTSRNTDVLVTSQTKPVIKKCKKEFNQNWNNNSSKGTYHNIGSSTQSGPANSKSDSKIKKTKKCLLSNVSKHFSGTESLKKHKISRRGEKRLKKVHRMTLTDVELALTWLSTNAVCESSISKSEPIQVLETSTEMSHKIALTQSSANAVCESSISKSEPIQVLETSVETQPKITLTQSSTDAVCESSISKLEPIQVLETSAETQPKITLTQSSTDAVCESSISKSVPIQVLETSAKTQPKIALTQSSTDAVCESSISKLEPIQVLETSAETQPKITLTQSGTNAVCESSISKLEPIQVLEISAEMQPKITLTQSSTNAVCESSISKLKPIQVLETSAKAPHDINVEPKLMKSKEVIQEPTSVQYRRDQRLTSSLQACAELSERLLKVKAAERLVLNRLKSSTVALYDHLSDQALKSRIFAQYFEEVDEQPGCLDLIRVNPKLVQDIPDLFKDCESKQQKQQQFNGSLLDASHLPQQPTASTLANDLEPVWAFGKTNSYFTEKPPLSSTKQSKPKKSSSSKTNKTTPSYLAFKKTLMKYNNSKRPVYRHHSQRPKLKVPFERKKTQEVEDEVTIGIEPYLVPWDIPKSSISSVVKKLEDCWAEEENFTGLNTEGCVLPNGSILTLEFVNYALTALRCDKMFTFSSKPKDGKNTVLLIRRECIGRAPEPCNRLENNLPKDSCFEEKADKPSKILLKLRKTGEISGSAIYSPDSVEEPVQVNDCKNADLYGNKINNQLPQLNKEPIDLGQTEVSFKTNEDIFEDLFTDDKIEPHSEQIRACDSENRSCGGQSPDFDSFCSVEEFKGFPVTFSPNSIEPEPNNWEHELQHNGATYSGQATPLTPDLYLSFPSSLSADDTDMSNAKCEDEFESNLQIMNWDEKITWSDDLEQMLLCMDDDCLEILEQALIGDGKAVLSPASFQQNLDAYKNKTEKKKAGHSKNLLESLQPSPHHTCKTDCYPSSAEHYGFTDCLSPFDSPELVRGNSQTKSSETSCAEPIDMNSSTENNICSTPQSTCVRETSVLCEVENKKVTKSTGESKSLIKTCNVLLQPLEGMLKNFRKSDIEMEETTSTSCSNKDVRTRFTDSSARELNRLLKNRALNGAYWTADVESSSMSSSSPGKWCLRDRRKKKVSEDTSVEIEVVDVEEDKVDIKMEKPAIQITYPKRKRRGSVSYTHPTDAELDEAAKTIWWSSDVRKSVGSKSGKLLISKTKLPADNENAVRTLFNGPIDFSQARQWLFETSLPRPTLFRFPMFYMRKSLGSRKTTSKNSAHDNDDSTSSTNVRDQESLSKKLKKDLNLFFEDLHRDEKLQRNEKIELLRRQLFSLRHPNYTGRLCSEASDSPHDVPKPSSGLSLSLIRVNADEARKQISPTLSTDFLLRYGTKETTKPRVSKSALFRVAKNGSDSEPCNSKCVSSPPHAEKNVPVVSLRSIDPEETPSCVTVSSRGRPLKPSVRNRTLTCEVPVPKKKRCTNTSLNNALEVPAETQRMRARFVHKHSSSGAYIKRILKSGIYNS